jgi:hypothetical protein
MSLSSVNSEAERDRQVDSTPPRGTGPAIPDPHDRLSSRLCAVGVTDSRAKGCPGAANTRRVKVSRGEKPQGL